MINSLQRSVAKIKLISLRIVPDSLKIVSIHLNITSYTSSLRLQRFQRFFETNSKQLFAENPLYFFCWFPMKPCLHLVISLFVVYLDIVHSRLEALLELALRTSAAVNDPYKDDLR